MFQPISLISSSLAMGIRKSACISGGGFIFYSFSTSVSFDVHQGCAISPSLLMIYTYDLLDT